MIKDVSMKNLFINLVMCILTNYMHCALKCNICTYVYICIYIYTIEIAILRYKLAIKTHY